MLTINNNTDTSRFMMLNVASSQEDIVLLFMTSFALIISNYCITLVNERTGGFTTIRYKLIGLTQDMLVLVTIPLCTLDIEHAPISLLALGFASTMEFGNCREFSFRWLYFGSNFKDKPILSFILVLCKHIHHNSVMVLFVRFLQTYKIDGAVDVTW